VLTCGCCYKTSKRSCSPHCYLRRTVKPCCNGVPDGPAQSRSPALGLPGVLLGPALTVVLQVICQRVLVEQVNGIAGSQPAVGLGIT